MIMHAFRLHYECTHPFDFVYVKYGCVQCVDVRVCACAWVCVGVRVGVLCMRGCGMDVCACVCVAPCPSGGICATTPLRSERSISAAYTSEVGRNCCSRTDLTHHSAPQRITALLFRIGAAHCTVSDFNYVAIQLSLIFSHLTLLSGAHEVAAARIRAVMPQWV